MEITKNTKYLTNQKIFQLKKMRLSYWIELRETLLSTNCIPIIDKLIFNEINEPLKHNKLKKDRRDNKINKEIENKEKLKQFELKRRQINNQFGLTKIK